MCLLTKKKKTKRKKNHSFILKFNDTLSAWTFWIAKNILFAFNFFFLLDIDVSLKKE